MRNGEQMTIENQQHNTDTQLLSPRTRRLKLIEQIKTTQDLQMSLQNIHNEVFEAVLEKYRAAGIRGLLCFDICDDCCCCYSTVQEVCETEIE